MEEIENLIDAHNEFNGNYTAIRDVNGSDPHKFNFVKSLKEDKIDANDFIHNRTAESLKGTKYEKGRTSLAADLEAADRMYSLTKYMKDYPNTEMSEKLYKMYLNKRFAKHPEMIEKFQSLNQKYGVKILPPEKFGNQMLETLDYVDLELAECVRASDGQAKMPPVIDFSKALSDWYNSSTFAFVQPKHNRAVHMSSTNSYTIRYAVSNALRHEMTHVNDLKHGVGIPKKYNLEKMFIEKSEISKYKQEFINAGLNDEQRINYAFTNPKEFIAVAAEGDMSKYSPEFKQMLIDFGMPEWMFKMKNIEI